MVDAGGGGWGDRDGGARQLAGAALACRVPMPAASLLTLGLPPA